MARRMLSGESVPLVSVLPPSPADGQVIDYLADSVNGVIWRFRYRTASASTYKWELVGGAPMCVQGSASINLPGGGWAFPGVRFQIVAPLAGTYRTTLMAQVHLTSGAGTGGIGISGAVAVATPDAPNAAYFSVGAGEYALMTIDGLVTRPTAGGVIDLATNLVSGIAGWEVLARNFMIEPVRVG